MTPLWVWLKATLAIARVTFQELVRDRILYNSVFFAAALFGLGYLGAEMSFVRAGRILFDFGISAINLATSITAILIGAGLISREYERRTVYVALAHPISRHQFILGKYLGLAGLLTVNWALLTAVFVGMMQLSVVWMHERAFILGQTAAIGLGLLLVQCWVIAGFAVLFSSFSTTALAVMLTFGIYLVGNSISAFKAVLKQSTVRALVNLMPNLEHFNLKLKLTYDLPIAPGFTLAAIVYGLVWVLLAVGLAGFTARTRENT